MATSAHVDGARQVMEIVATKAGGVVLVVFVVDLAERWRRTPSAAERCSGPMPTPPVQPDHYTTVAARDRPAARRPARAEDEHGDGRSHRGRWPAGRSLSLTVLYDERCPLRPPVEAKRWRSSPRCAPSASSRPPRRRPLFPCWTTSGRRGRSTVAAADGACDESERARPTCRGVLALLGNNPMAEHSELASDSTRPACRWTRLVSTAIGTGSSAATATASDAAVAALAVTLQHPAGRDDGDQERSNLVDDHRRGAPVVP